MNTIGSGFKSEETDDGHEERCLKELTLTVPQPYDS